MGTSGFDPRAGDGQIWPLASAGTADALPAATAARAHELAEQVVEYVRERCRKVEPATGAAAAYLDVVAMTVGYGWLPEAGGLALAGAVALGGLHLARRWGSQLLAVVLLLGAAASEALGLVAPAFLLPRGRDDHHHRPLNVGGSSSGFFCSFAMSVAAGTWLQNPSDDRMRWSPAASSHFIRTANAVCSCSKLGAPALCVTATPSERTRISFTFCRRFHSSTSIRRCVS